MAVLTADRSTTRVETVRSRLSDPAYQAFSLLRVGFVVAPILFGLDKFAHVLVDWDKYLAPDFADHLPWTTHQLMYAVGAIEIVAGLVVALRPRFGGYGDIALRDFGLLIGALALSRLASADYDHVDYRRT